MSGTHIEGRQGLLCNVWPIVMNPGTIMTSGFWRAVQCYLTGASHVHQYNSCPKGQWCCPMTTDEPSLDVDVLLLRHARFYIEQSHNNIQMKQFNNNNIATLARMNSGREPLHSASTNNHTINLQMKNLLTIILLLSREWTLEEPLHWASTTLDVPSNAGPFMIQGICIFLVSTSRHHDWIPLFTLPVLTTGCGYLPVYWWVFQRYALPGRIQTTIIQG